MVYCADVAVPAHKDRCMSNLVCVSGDFCSGSTLVFTLFRKTRQFYCLYEPLHERLREYLVYGLRPDEQSHHFFVDQYYREFRGFRHAGALFDPRWGASDLYLPADAEADADPLYRYLSYIIGMSFGRAPRVMFKENRMVFRLGWFRARFPHAKIVHIHRNKEAQWKSIVRRVQAHHGRQDVGQESVHFTGFNVARWCEDLKGRYPELAADRSHTGFERFAKLWERSYEENRRYADISIDYDDLLRRFDETMIGLWSAIGAPPLDVASLRQFVVPPQKHGSQKVLDMPFAAVRVAVDRALRKYAKVRVRVESALREHDQPARRY